jgi:formate dehydrogenase gamma subunit
MSEQKTYTRFSLLQRIEHWVLVASFATLGLTGLVQRYASWGISNGVMNILGGVEPTRIIHRVAAIIFALEAVYHLVNEGYKIIVLRSKPGLLPSPQDVQDGIESVKYNVGITDDQPRMGRFNFGEKLEYWAMIWGTVVMGITGFMMWNPIATSKIMPGQIIPTAKVAHSLEAVLAVLALMIWHFYNVHIRHLNKSMFTGKMTYHEMDEEHGGELDDIEAGKVFEPPAPELIQKRRKVYVPVAGVIGVLLVAGLIGLSTFEDTAITTVPPIMEDVVAFSPYTPTPALMATSAKPPSTDGAEQVAMEGDPASWNGGIGALLGDQCSSCHPEFGAYADAMASGMIVAGDSAGSSLISIQLAGGHYTQLEGSDVEILQGWIDAGAPEGEGGEMIAQEESPSANYCLECHTDKERLKVVADVVEEDESESSGPG